MMMETDRDVPLMHEKRTGQTLAHGGKNFHDGN